MQTQTRSPKWPAIAGMAVVREPRDDARTRPAYQDARGMTTLASGGRKRQIRAAA